MSDDKLAHVVDAAAKWLELKSIIDEPDDVVNPLSVSTSKDADA